MNDGGATHVFLRLRSWGLILAVAGLSLLAGCGSTGRHAPVVDRAVSQGGIPAPRKAATRPVRSPDSRPQSYTVQKGDTLYGISFEYGFDYKEVAEWNGIEAPYIIRPGQQIRFSQGGQSTQGGGEAQVAVMPLKGAAAESKPVSGDPTVKTEPKAIKLPYSEQALHAEVKSPANPALPPPAPPAVVAAPPVVAEKPPTKMVEEKKDSGTDDEEKVDWGWPTQGKVVGEFSESGSAKGVEIAGKNGQPVVATAAGKVVYSGSGLRGYGKLIIIKHNKTYLSAYAHNSQILVKEGQNVSKGQKIAEMGDSDADRVKLHFEIRRFGKPVDPMKYLSSDGAA
ncbi:MAG: peptidoglycan DD-metalloendopeptidase family protein [Sulfuricella sp.]|nr:peptidoglycan DD-metalloendopeptidase family protein [Sulfuricella sp.]